MPVIRRRCWDCSIPIWSSASCRFSSQIVFASCYFRFVACPSSVFLYLFSRYPFPIPFVLFISRILSFHSSNLSYDVSYVCFGHYEELDSTPCRRFLLAWRWFHRYCIGKYSWAPVRRNWWLLSISAAVQCWEVSPFPCSKDRRPSSCDIAIRWGVYNA